MKLEDSITTIKGIGDKTAECFARLGIYTVNDLLNTYPRDYLFYNEPVSIGSATVGERLAVCAIISSYVETKKVKNLQLTTLTIKDSTGTMRIVWYNSPFLRKVLHKGETYVFVGTVKIKNGMRTMDMPEYYKPDKYRDIMQELQPVYPLTHGLSNKAFQKAVTATREMIYDIRDYLPEDLCRKYCLMNLSEAYENIHYPMNADLLKNAIRRHAFDEFYRFLSEMGRLREENIKQENQHVVIKGKQVDEFVNDLPYKLTKGQLKAIDDILVDMGSENVMNRLIQGDVGSGKTVVAEIALYACSLQGFQGALMVPTEILAKQHVAELSERMKKYNIRVCGLFGSTPLKEKRRIYNELKDGDIDIIVGTHALIENKVEFKNLGLVVTDEQHRFGVNQRRQLANKGSFPHVLVMSATPIPRTLAIIMYADLDISIISELPKGRKAIKNCVVGTNYRNTAYKFIHDQVLSGSQAYVICPMVNESETMDLTNVTEYTDTLKAALGQEIKVEMLHGQMKAEQKNEIMNDFMDGKIQVLVSTTVIEVGINNPNATVMMVENAERFGLAQLHQLRGRVGRGIKQSYCIFIDCKESRESRERLSVLENSNDGFYIAGEDLRLRGPGDFFGIRQSGEILFRLADIYNHADMLKLARDVWEEYGGSLFDEMSEAAVDTTPIIPTL